MKETLTVTPSVDCFSRYLNVWSSSSDSNVSILEVQDMSMHSINISAWSQVPQAAAAAANVMQTFSLTISHRSRTEKVLSLNKPLYYFTVPDVAPPCEVYNFSVTATYVGATYTGVSCHVPSPVLSRMLPFLPGIFS